MSAPIHSTPPQRHLVVSDMPPTPHPSRSHEPFPKLPPVEEPEMRVEEVDMAVEESFVVDDPFSPNGVVVNVPTLLDASKKV